MKTNLILIFMTLLYACNPTNDEKTVSVVDYKNLTGGEPKLVNMASHKDKDVEVFRINGSVFSINGSKTYSTVMYRLEDGKLEAYESDVISNNNYDKATYNWINDSTLSFRFVNTSDSSSERYSMIGNKSWTRLEKINQ